MAARRVPVGSEYQAMISCASSRELEFVNVAPGEPPTQLRPK